MRFFTPERFEKMLRGLARVGVRPWLCAWQSGNGFQLTHPNLNSGSIVSDPESIDLGEYGIWTGDKQTLGGVTPLFGNQDRIQLIKVTIPGAMAVTVDTAGSAAQTITLTNPSGGTQTASAKVVSVTGPHYQPNNVNGNQKTVALKIATANTILIGN